MKRAGVKAGVPGGALAERAGGHAWCGGWNTVASRIPRQKHAPVPPGSDHWNEMGADAGTMHRRSRCFCTGVSLPMSPCAQESRPGPAQMSLGSATHDLP